MKQVAVVAHRRKMLGDGLPALRRALADAGVYEPIWCEVPKSKKAPRRVRQAVEDGAELVIVWGGDGMVQRCVDALVGAEVVIAIMPAGTANLFATNLGIPHDFDEALRTALGGRDRRIDVGVLNGEHFVVMAGAGFDARMIDDADAAAKESLGRLAYVRSSVSAMREKGGKVRVLVDGSPWFKGRATCVLVGNVSTASGGLTVFADAEVDDGMLDVGIVTAEGSAEWLRVLARAARQEVDRSPFVSLTKGRKIDVRFSKPTLYEMDGGAREEVNALKFRVKPSAITVRVPKDTSA